MVACRHSATAPAAAAATAAGAAAATAAAASSAASTLGTAAAASGRNRHRLNETPGRPGDRSSMQLTRRRQCFWPMLLTSPPPGTACPGSADGQGAMSCKLQSRFRSSWQSCKSVAAVALWTARPTPARLEGYSCHGSQSDVRKV